MEDPDGHELAVDDVVEGHGVHRVLHEAEGLHALDHLPGPGDWGVGQTVDIAGDLVEDPREDPSRRRRAVAA